MFPGRATHITKDMCFPGAGTHITGDIENTSWKVLAYGIYALVVDVSEILLVRCAHSFDF